MGIKGLLAFLRSLNPEVRQEVDLSLFKGNKLAIDVAIQSYAFKSQYIRKVSYKLDLIFEDVDYEDATIYVFKQYIKLCIQIIVSGLLPISVFDGKAPELKKRTQLGRIGKTTSGKDKIDRLRLIAKGFLGKIEYTPTEGDVDFLKSFNPPITTIDQIRARLNILINGMVRVYPEDYRKLEILLSNIGLPYIVAESEAEKTCSLMTMQKEVIATLTTDSDCLMYACPIMIDKIIGGRNTLVTRSPKVRCYSYQAVLEVTELTPSQFIDFCIMCGTDFNSNSDGFGPSTNLDLIHTYGSLKGIVAAKKTALEKKIINPWVKLNPEETLLSRFDEEILNYAEVMTYITTPEPYDTNAFKLRLDKDQYEQSFDFLSNYFGADVYEKFCSDVKTLIDRLLELQVQLGQDK